MDRKNERASEPKFTTKRRQAFMQTRPSPPPIYSVASKARPHKFTDAIHGEMCLLLLAPKLYFSPHHLTHTLGSVSLSLSSVMSFTLVNRLILLLEFDTLHFDVCRKKIVFAHNNFQHGLSLINSFLGSRQRQS